MRQGYFLLLIIQQNAHIVVMLAFATPPKAMKCGDGDVAQICDSLFCWCDYRIKNPKGKENVCDSWGV